MVGHESDDTGSVLAGCWAKHCDADSLGAAPDHPMSCLGATLPPLATCRTCPEAVFIPIRLPAKGGPDLRNRCILIGAPRGPDERKPFLPQLRQSVSLALMVNTFAPLLKWSPFYSALDTRSPSL
jgi:hypothetical protein